MRSGDIMMLPLVSPLNFSQDKELNYIECNDSVFSFDGRFSQTSSPGTVSPRPTLPDIGPFKHLLNIVEDKIQLLTENVNHMRKEIDEKNGTIHKLLDFINKVVHPKEVNDDDKYNDSVSEYNREVSEHNVINQRENITMRKKTKDCREPIVVDEVQVVEATKYDEQLEQTLSTTSITAIPAETCDSGRFEEEINFLKSEIINKNRVIDHLLGMRSDPRHRLIIEDEEDDDDNEAAHDTVPLHDNEGESMLDSTLEVMERLFVDEMTSIDSTLQLFDVTKEIDMNDVLEDTKEDEDVLEETKYPEEDPTFNEDVINKRIDNIEEMIVEMKRKAESTEEMSSVAPWDKHGNGFASNYMRKNGHQPGKGLGKSGHGITEPISTEKMFNAVSANDSAAWPKGTILIAGDSMIGGLEEQRMSRKHNVKVRSHLGATAGDMRDHLNALLRKKPDHLILHVHTNDAPHINSSADDIYDRLIDLKTLAESSVPGIEVVLSCPTVRRDNGLANAKLVQVKNRLKRSGLNIIDNDNILYDDLSRKGLHLKPPGTRKLAANMIAYMRSL